MKIVSHAGPSPGMNLDALRSEVVRLLEARFGLRVRRVKVRR